MGVYMLIKPLPGAKVGDVGEVWGNNAWINFGGHSFWVNTLLADGYIKAVEEDELEAILLKNSCAKVDVKRISSEVKAHFRKKVEGMECYGSQCGDAVIKRGDVLALFKEGQ